MTTTQPYLQFATAAQLVQQQLLLDAALQFMALAETYPGHELADDALYNAGLCYFHMNSFDTAIRIFKELIQNYPDATIHQQEHSGEFGRTAAKAHYSIINCYLGLNRVPEAKEELTALEPFNDAYVLSAMNETITYHELALKAIETFEQIS